MQTHAGYLADRVLVKPRRGEGGNRRTPTGQIGHTIRDGGQERDGLLLFPPVGACQGLRVYRRGWRVDRRGCTRTTCLRSVSQNYHMHMLNK